ncbi:MAG: hypothetical protein ACOYYS_22555 [Chloroflexota bacterium]
MDFTLQDEVCSPYSAWQQSAQKRRPPGRWPVWAWGHSMLCCFAHQVQQKIRPSSRS